jgi:hypothetical protein
MESELDVIRGHNGNRRNLGAGISPTREYWTMTTLVSFKAKGLVLSHPQHCYW